MIDPEWVAEIMSEKSPIDLCCTREGLGKTWWWWRHPDWSDVFCKGGRTEAGRPLWVWVIYDARKKTALVLDAFDMSERAEELVGHLVL